MANKERKGISFMRAVKKAVLAFFAEHGTSERKDSHSVASFTAAEIATKVRPTLRPVIEALDAADMIPDELREEAEERGVKDLTVAIVNKTLIAQAVSQLLTDLPRRDEDGAVLKDGAKGIIRERGTSLLVRDPWSDTTDRKGHTLVCLRAEYDRAKEARSGTFPAFEDSLEAATVAFNASVKAAEGDRWAMLSLARSLGVQGDPKAWLAMAEEDRLAATNLQDEDEDENDED